MQFTRITANPVGSELMCILNGDDIEPGSSPSYQLCKALYLYHPLGKKMAESPIAMAQSQPREIAMKGEAPDEVIEAFACEWERVAADSNIRNVKSLSRAYGISTIVLGCEQAAPDKPLDMAKIWEQDLFFNVLDPLNTAGSLVLDQIPTASDFQKPVTVRTNGQAFHHSRYRVVMNEAPIYIAYTNSAFGFVGRSVYQRALYPLKSFLRSMLADDMITAKLGVLIAKTESPSSVIDVIMEKMAGIKRALLRDSQTGNVMQIGEKDAIETLNMQNVDGAGTFARDNILRNIATAADMPASLLNNETMVKGFGEGSEDAKNIARFIHGIRQEMQPLYAWFDNIVQHLAWNPEFYKRMQRKYPEQFGKREYADAFSEWREHFVAEWPSWLIEPESEQIRVSDVKFQATIALLQSLMPELDPENQVRLIQWAADTVADNKLMFEHGLDLDLDEVRTFKVEQQEQNRLLQQAGQEGEPNDGVAKKMGRFDSWSHGDAISRLRQAVGRLPQTRQERLLAAAGMR